MQSLEGFEWFLALAPVLFCLWLWVWLPRSRSIIISDCEKAVRYLKPVQGTFGVRLATGDHEYRFRDLDGAHVWYKESADNLQTVRFAVPGTSGVMVFRYYEGKLTAWLKGKRTNLCSPDLARRAELWLQLIQKNLPPHRVRPAA